MTDAQRQALTQLLREAGELSARDSIVALKQIMGGWSRHSYIATAELPSEEIKKFVVRCKPKGALLDTDLKREYEIYTYLHSEDIPAPRPVTICLDEDNPFNGQYFVMDFVPGRVFNIFDKKDQELLASDWKQNRQIATDIVRTLARIHKLSAEEFPATVPSLSFQESVKQWQGVYEEHFLIRDPVIEEGFSWLAERAPSNEWPGLVHGDYRIGNTLIENGRISAVLDWELAYRGDVRFDLGYISLPRSAGKHLVKCSPLMGTVADQNWFFERYEEYAGKKLGLADLETFQMLSMMMILGTQLMATSMYHQGKTSDMRMAWSRFSFPGLRQDMARLMKW